jgi:hypothetical protein
VRGCVSVFADVRDAYKLLNAEWCMAVLYGVLQQSGVARGCRARGLLSCMLMPGLRAEPRLQKNAGCSFRRTCR